MAALLDLPLWALAAVIFGLRIVDVSLGTIRVLAVVQGRIRLSVLLGFFEVGIWVVAVSQVIAGIRESPLLLLAYAGGFAAGNAAGILLERRLALGAVVLRIITHAADGRMAEQLRSHGHPLTTFRGEGRDGAVTLLYITCPRAALNAVLAEARGVDPDFFYVVEPAREWGHGFARTRSSTFSWHSLLKKR